MRLVRLFPGVPFDVRCILQIVNGIVRMFNRPGFGSCVAELPALFAAETQHIRMGEHRLVRVQLHEVGDKDDRACFHLHCSGQHGDRVLAVHFCLLP